MPKLSTLLCLMLLALSFRAVAQGSTEPSGSPAARSATPSSSWQDAITLRRQELIARNGAGTEPGLRDRLLKMRHADQVARGLATGTTSQGTQHERLQQLTDTDAELTSELKSIVAQGGWPTISLVGIEASDAAMLLLTHTADHAWQLQLLPQLEQLADEGKIDPSSLALVIDKQLVAAGKLQRYGTQFKLVNGHMAMYAVEDPGNLDAIRNRAMLQPLSSYKELLAKMYELKPTSEIVSATAPIASAAASTR